MTRPVVTVTLNPAIDRTVWVDELVPGKTHRTSDTRRTFGGKGINVAVVVARIGAPAVALGLIGEDQAAAMESHLESLGVRARFIRVPGETRTNLKVIEQGSGRLTEINGSGPEVPPALVDALEQQLERVVHEESAAAVVFAGSVPLGVNPGIYGQWTERLRAREPGVRVLVDTSGDALELAARSAPFFVKPNRVEAESLTGRPVESTSDAISAARHITARGPRTVLLSLGARGAVAAWGEETEVIHPQPIELPAGQLLTTVAAGDAMVARVAVELAGLDGAVIGSDEFFAISRRAASEAEGQISRAVPMVHS
jgi:1-phosphofructokinase